MNLSQQAGACVGLGISLVVYPLDTLKTRIQAPWYHESYGSTAAARNPALYRGLYQGVGAVIIASVPSSGVFFSTYEASKYALRSSLLPTPFVHGISSALAQTITSAIVISGEVIKQNAQVAVQNLQNPRNHLHTLNIAKHILSSTHPDFGEDIRLF
jgi:solute carrier family 25 S-adenosylmethionine transporter 26